MIIPVSYPLYKGSPLYPGTPEILCRSHKSIKQGDSANSSTLIINSHTGTHIDVPSHFCINGTSVIDHLPSYKSFYPAYCLDFPIQDPIEIIPETFEKIIGPMHDAVALLIRTGWWKKRSSDPSSYCSDHPWISERFPGFIREKCPNIRIFGIDQISVSSPSHRDAGRECHKRFLCDKSPILILEDMDLSDEKVLSIVFTLHIYPFFIDDNDGTPVIALIERLRDEI